MPRKRRIHFPGAVYHVTLRGNAGQDVFRDDADRSRFTLLLQEGIERFEHRIHAFCLMSNHVHLALQGRTVPLSTIMQNVGFRYTQYFNRRYDQKGHLFQGRYKALLVDADSYLLELVRYIHLNPVRGGIVAQPEDYSWSGHGAYLGQQFIPWLKTGWVLGQFSGEQAEAVRLYRNFVADGLGEGHRKDFHGGTFESRILGDDDFVEKALGDSGEEIRPEPTLEQIMDDICRECDVSLQELASGSRSRNLSAARALAAMRVRKTPGLTLTDLAKKFSLDPSSLSQAARRLEMRGIGEREK